MEKEEATRILGDNIKPDSSLRYFDFRVDWRVGETNAFLDGTFDTKELEAIVWWMRNTKEKEGEEDGN